MSGSARLVRAGALAALLALAPGCDANLPAGAVGTTMQPYAARSLEGDSVSLESFKDEVVLLNVWATWCAPCRREIPELQVLQERYGERGLKVVGVSLDAPGSNERVREFLQEFGVEYTILRDPHEAIGGLLGVVGMPTTVLIDREGVIRWRHLGAVTADDPALLEALESTL
ncbi:MAG TPA: TlpA disulfide reductase family protein [Longimicrobiales bacterium]|nr:TlpA disulfide reductase family protein [Longimicrobiales bacterium]